MIAIGIATHKTLLAFIYLLMGVHSGIRYPRLAHLDIAVHDAGPARL